MFNKEGNVTLMLCIHLTLGLLFGCFYLCFERMKKNEKDSI